MLLGQLGEPRENGEIRFNAALDARLLNLENHGFTGRQPGPMHLRDRRRRECPLLEVAEDRFRRAAQFLLERLAHGGGLVGDGIRLQAAELFGELAADDIGARAQHLPKLDERGAELGQRQPEAFGSRELADGLAFNAAQSVTNGTERNRLEPVGEPELGQHTNNLRDAAGVAFQSFDGTNVEHGYKVG